MGDPEPLDVLQVFFEHEGFGYDQGHLYSVLGERPIQVWSEMAGTHSCVKHVMQLRACEANRQVASSWCE